MSHQAEPSFPDVVDALEFAARRRVAEGVVPVAALARLADVADGDALACRVEGERDEEGKSWLRLDISGRLVMVCQRCLGAMEFPLRVENRLLLVPPGQPWPEDELSEDGYDAVAAEKEMALLPLIEEEILLALPIAPRHEACEIPALAAGQELSPFAVLAKFRKGV